MATTKLSPDGAHEKRLAAMSSVIAAVGLTVLVIVDITSPYQSEQSLGDGYRLEASFIIWEGKDILQVPASALFRKQEGWAVFVVKNNKALLREVKVGNRTGLSAEILSGLTESEEVISHPDNSIGGGTRVRPR
jgi:HlyD family secretion protein